MEAWDAKYKKPYLIDELGELEDKLPANKGIQVAGFVVDSEPDIRDDVRQKVRELEEVYGLRVNILSFVEWLAVQFGRSMDRPDNLARRWLDAYAETLCHKRSAIAPIDEPSEVWVKELSKLLRKCL